MRISELFTSIQGEGIYAGYSTSFVRFFGCPLRCVWCDTKYTWDDKSRFEELTTEDVLRFLLRRNSTRYVCITGGEPLAPYNVDDTIVLAERLEAFNRSISLETSGCFIIPELLLTTIDSIVWDVKLPGSGEFESNEFDQLWKLGEKDQIKFVIKGSTDFEEARRVVKDYDLDTRCTVLWSPVYKECDLSWLAEKVTALGGRNNKLSLQMHKQIWGERRGK